uniref:Reverse transcriptase zinc-binding domain-containing protein n=1 Tax=Cannabis sativa TaxID=3483 RepID=A0A803P0N1_CANSA
MRVGGIVIFVNSLCYLVGVHVKGVVHVPCLHVDRLIFCKLCGLCGAVPEVEVSSLLCGPLFVGCIGLALGPGGLNSFGVCGLPWLMCGTTPMAVCLINGPIRLGHVVGSINGSFLGAMRAVAVAWNCRGLGQTSTVRELKSLARSYAPDFIFLSELKVDAKPLVRILNKLHFYFHISMPAIGTAGGIILAWKSGFDFASISCSRHQISGLVYSDPPSNPWLLSCVYGPPYFHAKKSFWTEIMREGERFGGPWLIVGDTNFVLKESERKDHRPLCLFFGGDVEKFRRTFRFEEGWTRDERSKLVVSQAWNSVVHNWAPTRMFKKIGATRVALIHWHKTQYGKVDASIKNLEYKLNTLQRLPVGSRDWKVECEVRKALNEALERREIYWKQRARVSWLREGDKCSNFFFLSATIRGRRNAIESILDSNNVRLTRRIIGNEFTGCEDHPVLWPSSRGPFIPYLFIWAAEILSRLLEEALRSGNIKGQHVNKLKTSIFFGNNTPVGVRKEIKEALGIGRSDGNPMYAMQTTKLSNRLVTRIDGMVRDFWWGFEKGNHGLHLKAWDKLCLPKSRGGLGFRKTKEMNLAFLAKWEWNLLTGSQSLCCRILEAKYLKGKELFHCKYKDSDSWFWKNVVKETNILRQGACKVVSDGKDKRIWEDPWVTHGKSFIPKSNGSSSDGFNKVADILTSDGKWDIQKLTGLFDHDTIAAILKGGHPSGNGSDKWIWTKDRNGRFSCKSAYLIQALQRAPSCDVAPSLWNRLWNSKILERHKVLWWCILSNALPLRAIIKKRFYIEEVICFLCGREEESAEHLFLSCDFAFHLWRSSPWGIYPVTGSGIRVWDWVKFLWGLGSKGLNVEEVFIYASVVVDTIWRARNDKIHNNYSPNLDNCIDSTLCIFTNLKGTLLPDVVPIQREDWRHPPQDWLKLNCDVRVGLGSSGIAVVARNHLGEVVWVHSARLDYADALCGEAAAVCLALETAKLNGDLEFELIAHKARKSKTPQNPSVTFEAELIESRNSTQEAIRDMGSDFETWVFTSPNKRRLMGLIRPKSGLRHLSLDCPTSRLQTQPPHLPHHDQDFNRREVIQQCRDLVDGVMAGACEMSAEH